MIVLGIAGFARSGKDTFVSIAKEILGKNGYTAIRVAFADKLKEEVVDMLKDNGFKADVYTINTDDKTLLRPLLVWWGCQRRRESVGGLYWVEQAGKKIEETLEIASNPLVDINQIVFLVSDVRFPNESSWVKQSHNGEVIHLKRYTASKRYEVDIPNNHPHDYPDYPSERLQDAIRAHYALTTDYKFSIREVEHREFDPAPNDEELKQDPLVIAMADQKVEWANKGNLPPEKAVLEPYLRQVVFETLNKSQFFNGSLQ